MGVAVGSGHESGDSHGDLGPDSRGQTMNLKSDKGHERVEKRRKRSSCRLA